MKMVIAVPVRFTVPSTLFLFQLALYPYRYASIFSMECKKYWKVTNLWRTLKMKKNDVVFFLISSWKYQYELEYWEVIVFKSSFLFHYCRLLFLRLTFDDDRESIYSVLFFLFSWLDLWPTFYFFYRSSFTILEDI